MGETIIIGGGVAGMTAGIYCRLSGIPCTVVEKNKITGGNLTGWKRGDYYIDNCLHWLTGTLAGTSLNDMWRTVGAIGNETEMYRPEAFVTAEYNKKRLSLHRDPELTLAEMLEVSPPDAEESIAFISAVRAASRCVREKREKGFSGKLSSAADKLYLAFVFMKYGRLSLSDLAKRFESPLIRHLLTDGMTGETAAVALIFAYAAHTAGNADIPFGGSVEMAKNIEARLLSLGGRIIYGNPAQKIVLNRAGLATCVKLKDGTTLPCNAVISACDPSLTFGRLLPESFMPLPLKRRYKDKRTPLFSSVHVAFSCDVRRLPFTGTFSFRIPPMRIDRKKAERMVVREYSYDKNAAPSGETVLQAIFFVRKTEADAWVRLSRENKEGYSRAKRKFAESAARRLLTRFPELKNSLKVLDVWTPATYNRYFGSKSGAYMGFAPTARSFMHRMPSDIPGLRNVFLATQWQSSPGGLPTAAGHGKQAAKAVGVFLRSKNTETRKTHFKYVLQKVTE